jgi:hypothetical protein
MAYTPTDHVALAIRVVGWLVFLLMMSGFTSLILISKSLLWLLVAAASFMGSCALDTIVGDAERELGNERDQALWVRRQLGWD